MGPMKTENESEASFRQYPLLSLPDAINVARSVYDAEKRTVLNYEVAAIAMGHSALSGPAKQKISTLRKYGLMESVGDGIQISQLALRLFHQSNTDADYHVALKEAALRPSLFQKLVETHRQASEEAITSH